MSSAVTRRSRDRRPCRCRTTPRPATSDRAHGAALGKPENAGAERGVGIGDRGVQRDEQRGIADEEAGVERVVSRELLANGRDAISGEPNFCGLGGHVGIGERRVDGQQRLTGCADVRSSCESTDASNRWSPISRAKRRSRRALRAARTDRPFSSCQSGL